MTKLTPRQLEIYQYLAGYIASHQYPPTVREIMQHFGFKSPNSVMIHLKPMRKKGWLNWQDGLSRSIAILNQPEPLSVQVANAACVYLKSESKDDFAKLAKLVVKYRKSRKA